MVTTIRLPDELHKQVKQKAQEKGLSLNSYILSVLWGLVGEVEKD